MKPKASLSLLLPAIFVCGCILDPQKREARYLESGKAMLARRDYTRAAIQFQNAARVRPLDAEPWYQIGLVRLALGSPEHAAQAFLKATQLNPKHAGAQIQLADLMARSPEKAVLEDGEKRMQEVLRAAPDNPEALSALALAEVRLGKQQIAEQHLRQALEKSPTSLLAAVRLARLKLDGKDVAGAEAVLRQSVAASPQSTHSHMALAELYLTVGYYPKARQQFDRILALDPKSGPALLGLAAVELQAGNKPAAEELYRRAAALPQKQYRHLHAVFLLQDGQADLAIAELQKLTREDPKDRAARNRLVAALMLAGRIPEAEDLLRSALEANPRDVDALLARAEILLRSGAWPAAQQDLERVLGQRPDSAEVHYLLASVGRLRGEPTLQQRELGEALRFNPYLLAARIDLARLLTERNSPKAALDLLEQAPENQRRTMAVLIQANWARLALGDRSGLRQAIAGGLAVSRHPELLLQDGIVRLQRKDYSGARAALEEALRLDPDHLRAISALALTYSLQQGPQAALRKLGEYAAQHPGSARAQYVLGQWFLAQDDRGGARNAFLTARKADFRFVPAALALAQLDLQAGDLNSARRILGALVAANREAVTAGLLLASAEYKSGNAEAAIARYRGVLTLAPKNATALNNLAYLLVEAANRPDEALPYAQQASELNPRNPNAQGTLGWVLYRKGFYNSALDHLAAAVALDGAAASEGAVIRKYHLAMTYLKLGDRLRARQLLETALALNPGLAEAKMAKDVLAHSRP